MYDHELPLLQVAYLHGDEAIAVCGFANEITIWDIEKQATQSPRMQLRSPGQEVGGLVVLNDNSLVCGDGAGSVTRWDLATGELH